MTKKNYYSIKQYSDIKARKVVFFKRKSFILLLGVLLGVCIVLSFYQASVYLSTDESCMKCHVHPHVEVSWKKSKHYNNESGTVTHCVDCHLPPQSNTLSYYKAKIRLGFHDAWGYLFKDSADYDWEAMSAIEHANTYISDESCLNCHHNLYPKGVSEDAIVAHLYYEKNEKDLDLRCISCHLDAGHFDPNYKHEKMSLNALTIAKADSSLFFKSATPINGFVNFTEKIPGSLVSFEMIAIPGGTFSMGSPDDEEFRNSDEGPVHTVNISPFFMSEVEVTWDMYWEFYSKTMSEGRIAPADVFAHNSRSDVDAVSGPTPPFGFPDQGWGGGSRPAITMTHYAAETFCQWLSLVTGKKYRLPTEAEWEYAARGGTQTPYFFAGTPSKYSNQGFWRKFFDATTDEISLYAVYDNVSRKRTQTPDVVKPNPFGLKNMLGNVMEYCADKYDPQAYSQIGNNADNPLITNGTEYVVRGGNYDSDAADIRCAARDHTRHNDWLKTDPQQPKSIWWYSDVKGIGFRVVISD